MLPATGGPHPSGVMARRLRSGKLACLAAGHDPSRTGVPVTSIQPAGSDTAPHTCEGAGRTVSHPYFAAYSPAPNRLICACATTVTSTALVAPIRQGGCGVLTFEAAVERAG